jgi:hypothetical protein
MHLMTYAMNMRGAPALVVGVLATALAGCGRPTTTQQNAPAPEVVKPAQAQTAPSTPAPQPAPPVTPAPVAEKPAAPAAVANAPAAKPAPATASGTFIAYYFHRTMRCPTCLAIERNSKEAVEKGFVPDLKSGRLTWRAVNIEEPGNEHFEKDFELESSSLVLVEMSGDQVTRWKNLEEVWELVSAPPDLHEYVRTELAAFMAGGKAAP